MDLSFRESALCIEHKLYELISCKHYKKGIFVIGYILHF